MFLHRCYAANVDGVDRGNAKMKHFFMNDLINSTISIRAHTVRVYLTLVLNTSVPLA